MNPYLTIPIALPGAEGIDGKPGEEGKPGNGNRIVPCKILPANVIAYHEGFAWGTFIYLTTGQAFCCTLAVKEYEETVRKYWLEFGKAAAQRTGRIQPINGGRN